MLLFIASQCESMLPLHRSVISDIEYAIFIKKAVRGGHVRVLFERKAGTTAGDNQLIHGTQSTTNGNLSALRALLMGKPSMGAEAQFQMLSHRFGSLLSRFASSRNKNAR